MNTSARNQWSGTVARISRGAVNDEIELDLPGGDTIAAVVTHESVQNLGLEIGREAIALVTASSVLIVTLEGRGPGLSARNRLRGTITRLATGAVNTEVVIGLRGGNSVAAMITNGEANALGLAVGQEAIAVFKASSVILGVM